MFIPGEQAPVRQLLPSAESQKRTRYIDVSEWDELMVRRCAKNGPWNEPNTTNKNVLHEKDDSSAYNWHAVDVRAARHWILTGKWAIPMRCHTDPIGETIDGSERRAGKECVQFASQLLLILKKRVVSLQLGCFVAMQHELKWNSKQASTIQGVYQQTKSIPGLKQALSAIIRRNDKDRCANSHAVTLAHASTLRPKRWQVCKVL